MTNLTISTDAKSNSPTVVDSTEFAQCVENINVLNLRLKNSEERCQLLRADLRQAKQVSIELMQSEFSAPPTLHNIYIKRQLTK